MLLVKSETIETLEVVIATVCGNLQARNKNATECNRMQRSIAVRSKVRTEFGLLVRTKFERLHT